MSVTVMVEEYGFMMFPEVFDGPLWATFPRDAAEAPPQPRGHLAAVHTDEETALGEVLNRAAVEFGISLSAQTLSYGPGATVADRIDGVAFFQPDDPNITWLPKRRFVRRLPGVDAAGRLWIKDYRVVTIAELLRAEALDLVEGEVLHPYLRPAVSAGAMGIAAGEWANVVEALRALWHILDTLAPLGTLPTLVWLGQPLLKRLRRATAAVERTNPPLAGRNVSPGQLATLLDRRRWLPSECARLLSTSEKEAIEYLAVLGFEPDESGIWSRGNEETPRLVRTSVDIVTHADVAHPPEVEARIRYVVETLEKTGHTPQLEDVFSDSVWSWDAQQEDEQ